MKTGNDLGMNGSERRDIVGSRCEQVDIDVSVKWSCSSLSHYHTLLLSGVKATLVLDTLFNLNNFESPALVSLIFDYR
jgi:hypothetical protein